ncbi:MAG: hypothetical protein PHW63_07100 [Alphaproteobacteria bacterium]|nr:hypothetical protein [Alphaproteobacteria bacterium]
MQRLKNALEELDEAISGLEDKVGIAMVDRTEAQKKMADILRQSKVREATIVAAAQKVALRLDQSIDHVEKILKK